MKNVLLKTFMVLGVFSIFFGLFAPSPVLAQYNMGGYAQYQQGPQSAVKTSGSLGSSILGGVANDVGSAVMNNVVVPVIQNGAVGILSVVQLVFLWSGKGFDLILEQTLIHDTLIKLIDVPILVAWKLVRDVSNIVIVFSLLYLGIRTILNGNGFADTRTLVGVLIAAIFINFSLFLTQTVYNVSNYLAAQIGEQIRFEGGSNKESGITNVSEGIMGIIKPQSVINVLSSAQTGDGSLSTAIGRLQAVILTSFVLIMLLVILFAASTMLLYRFLVFVVLMIMSPIGLIGMFIPWLNEVGRKWWSQMRAQSLFMPAFMLTLYISLLFVGYVSQNFSQVDFSVALGDAGAIEKFASNSLWFLFNFGLVFGFLLLIIILPSKIAGAGSELMMSTSKWAARRVGEYTARGGAALGRNTIGRAGAAIVGSTAVKDAASAGGIRGMAARRIIGVGNNLQSQAFDARNVGGIGKKLGLGEVKKGGYKGRLGQAKKDAEDKRDMEFKLYGIEDQQKAIDQAKKEFGTNFVPAVRNFDMTASQAKTAALKLTETQLKSQLSALQAENPTSPEDIRKNQANIKAVEGQIKTNKGAQDAESAKVKMVKDLQGRQELLNRYEKNKPVGFAAYTDLMHRRVHGGTLVTRTLKFIRNGGNKRFLFNPTVKSYMKVAKDLSERKTYDAYKENKNKAQKDKDEENRRKVREKQLEDKDKK